MASGECTFVSWSLFLDTSKCVLSARHSDLLLFSLSLSLSLSLFLSFSLLLYSTLLYSASLSLSWLAKSSVVHSRHRQRNGVCNKRHEQELMISLVINCVSLVLGWRRGKGKEAKERIRYSLLSAFILRSLGWSSRAAKKNSCTFFLYCSCSLTCSIILPA